MFGSAFKHLCALQLFVIIGFSSVGAYEAGLTSTNIAENETQVAELTVEQFYDNAFISLLESTQVKFPLFYNACIVPGLETEGAPMLFTQGSDGGSQLNPLACEGKYSKEFSALNAFFERINEPVSEDSMERVEGVESEESETPDFSVEEANTTLAFYASKIERIDAIWSSINWNYQQTPTVEIVLSSLSFIMELESISLETYLLASNMNLIQE